MARHSHLLGGVLFAAFGLAVSGCASAADHRPAQKIYLDPQTGDVIDHPGVAAQASGQAAARATGNTTPPYTPWTTRDGVQMLRVDPTQGPAEHVQRCGDGSFRMGHAAGSDDVSNDTTLCDSTGS